MQKRENAFEKFALKGGDRMRKGKEMGENRVLREERVIMLNTNEKDPVSERSSHWRKLTGRGLC